MRKVALNLILFNILGLIYYLLEIAFDGDSHWSMYLLGGICGYLIGQLNERVLTWDTPLWKQILIGECIVLPLEFLTGVIVNLWLGLNIWDYSQLPLNLLGQTSLVFGLVFIPVILLAILIDDYYRYFFMGEEKPQYKLFKR